MNHLTAQILIDYLEHKLPAPMEAQIKSHVADCNQCFALERRVQRLSSVLDNWTASVRAAALKKRAASGSGRRLTATDAPPSRPARGDLPLSGTTGPCPKELPGNHGGPHLSIPPNY